jgi:hypothetical protein
MTVDDALACLTAGVDEDEKRAKAGLRVRELDREMYGISMADIRISGVIRDAGDPRRVLLEVALKRLILREHQSIEYSYRWDHEQGRWITRLACEACSTLTGPCNDAEDEYEPWPCNYIRALEDIYSNRRETL